MSSQALPESNPATRPAEIAPSTVASDEPSVARIIGLMGMMASVLGLTVVTFNEIYGPRIVSKSGGLFFVAFGLSAMLFHAIRDGDLQIRRAYGSIGFGLLGLMLILSLMNTRNFLSYGWACALAGLCFLLTFSRHETDPTWRQRILWTFGGVGAAMASIGFIGGIVTEGFLLTYGLICTILGLAYLCAFISQSDSASEVRHKTGLAIGGVAVFAIIYAALRSALPDLIGMKVSPFFVPTGLLMIFLGLVYAAVSLAVVSDNRLVVLTRRELTSYFYSPVAYIVMLGMALLGFIAYLLFINLIIRGDVQYEPIVSNYFNFFPPIVVIFVVPAITMRLMAEEKRTGTYEVLMCAPVKETTVVLSKFIAGLIFFMLLWGIWALYLIALRVEGGKEFDYRPILSFYLALLFCGASFVSMGLFFSSLSKNQIIGAVLTFIGMLAAIVVSMVQNAEFVGKVWQGVFRHISFRELWGESLNGRIHVRDMILQGSFSIFWLFLTVKVLEARRWS